MCNADLSLYPYYWSGMYWHRTSVSAQVKRKCVNWDSVYDFRLNRHYSADDVVLPEEYSDDYLTQNRDPE